MVTNLMNIILILDLTPDSTPPWTWPVGLLRARALWDSWPHASWPRPVGLVWAVGRWQASWASWSTMAGPTAPASWPTLGLISTKSLAQHQVKFGPHTTRARDRTFFPTLHTKKVDFKTLSGDNQYFDEKKSGLMSVGI